MLRNQENNLYHKLYI